MIVGGIERWIPVVIVATCAIPVGLVAALLLARARARQDVPSAWRRSWTEVGMLVATLPWLWMMMCCSMPRARASPPCVPGRGGTGQGRTRPEETHDGRGLGTVTPQEARLGGDNKS